MLQNERVHNEVIIKRLPENNRDSDAVNEICSTVQALVKPFSLHRLGKLQPGRPCLLKATFSSSFDARAFMAKIDETKKTGTQPMVQNISCRPGHTREERALYKKRSPSVYKLNQQSGPDQSYSLRKDGKIWRFVRMDSGAWKRDTSWVDPPTSTAANQDADPDTNTQNQNSTAANASPDAGNEGNGLRA